MEWVKKKKNLRKYPEAENTHAERLIYYVAKF
jgi:hypothetical protein